ncbi:hypothetical protein BDV29DRAFT_129360 [Aspergillus leporis]|jgi:hypothetical protein|uniref:NmrA-like domain-containing protein n=1 Tax=Aspergillus leporis TaxID=41062 RepID=A0A5N5XDH5_9EURO|nr:hypothetical protein BDV29DRAFT_129360 [Aspergillus leporis]
MPSPKPAIAIAGGTGHLGKYITTALLSPPFINNFSSIILLTRQETSHPHQHPPPIPQIPNTTADTKLQVRNYTENNLPAALKDIQILINAIGPSGHAFKEQLLRALPQTDIQVYFPSEFGVNHYVHDFAHLEWDAKKAHFNLARVLIPNVKICRVFCGLFMEDSVGPWFGFDTKAGRYESVGSSRVPVSFTGLIDVGRVVAALCGFDRKEIPDVVSVGGDTRAISDVARIMEEAGAGKIDVREIELREYKERVTGVLSSDPAAYLRFLMGEGKINHSFGGLGCDNELVNPGQRVWKWKSFVELARETGGRPWEDFAWSTK